MVLTGNFVYYSMTLQGLLKDLPAVFKDYKIMKNIDLHNEILLQQCLTEIMKILALENRYKTAAPLYTDLSRHQQC